MPLDAGPPEAYVTYCVGDGACGPGMWCVEDRAAPGDGDIYDTCEPTCASDADCPNPATICSAHAIPLTSTDVGTTCSINWCTAPGEVAGSACDVGPAGAGGGTCVPFFVAEAMVCVRTGSATTCSDDGGDDGPFLQIGTLVNDPALLCPAGEGCDPPEGQTAGGACVQLCPLPIDAGRSPCLAGTVCVKQDVFDPTWGFCLPCVSSGSDGGAAGLCLEDADCCEGECAIGFAGLGYCQPRDD